MQSKLVPNLARRAEHYFSENKRVVKGRILAVTINSFCSCISTISCVSVMGSNFRARCLGFRRSWGFWKAYNSIWFEFHQELWERYEYQLNSFWNNYCFKCDALRCSQFSCIILFCLAKRIQWQKWSQTMFNRLWTTYSTVWDTCKSSRCLWSPFQWGRLPWLLHRLRGCWPCFGCHVIHQEGIS